MTGTLEDSVRVYCQQLGMSDHETDRTVQQVDYWTSITRVSYDRVFLSQRLSDRRPAELEDLWLFSPRLVAECHSFLTSNRWDLMVIQRSLTRIEVDRADFEPGTEVTERSRLTVHCVFGSSLASATFNAAGINCSRLQRLVVERLLPNLVESSSR